MSTVMFFWVLVRILAEDMCLHNLQFPHGVVDEDDFGGGVISL